jgi:hypothetical protein
VGLVVGVGVFIQTSNETRENTLSARNHHSAALAKSLDSLICPSER